MKEKKDPKRKNDGPWTRGDELGNVAPSESISNARGHQDVGKGGDASEREGKGCAENNVRRCKRHSQ